MSSRVICYRAKLANKLPVIGKLVEIQRPAVSEHLTKAFRRSEDITDVFDNLLRTQQSLPTWTGFPGKISTKKE